MQMTTKIPWMGEKEESKVATIPGSSETAKSRSGFRPFPAAEGEPLADNDLVERLRDELGV
jgi:hypothetical protein